MAEAGKIRERTNQVNLKPLPQSASTDILLSTKVQGTVLTVGLAVKNYSTSAVTARIVDEERKKFNKLLTKKDGCLNVLFICATNYGPRLQTAFGNAKSVIYTEEMQSKEKKISVKFIHEVILLNLTTPQNRAEFFGLTPNGDLHKCLEDVILKVPVSLVETVPSKEG
ncbi:hypothetical protein V7S43_008964 [Phytophthora oleae]|uniref:Uncharacterized protein n=1 Tax=Phytophthora oleae TaxID=2107226 RepID=A0ABD3FKR6_9STRA